MKNTFLKTIGTAALAIFMLVIFAQIPVSAQDTSGEAQLGELSDELLPQDESARRANARKLEGVWDILVTFRNCQTGEAIRTAPATSTYVRGGTMVEFGTGSAPLPRSPGQGVWSYIAGRHYTSVFKFFRFGADGSLIGTTKVHRQIELSRNENTLNITSASEVFNASGVLIANGCSTETGTRFE